NEEALLFFNKINSYEARLNRIVLLLRRRDVYYACEQYYNLYSDFGGKYNVLADLSWALGKDAKDYIGAFEKYGKSTKRERNKRNADKKKCVKLEQFEEDSVVTDIGDGEYDDIDAYFDGDLPIEELESALTSRRKSTFYLTGSNEYYDFLRRQLEVCLMSGKISDGEKIAERILSSNTDYLPLLETKLYLLLVKGKTDEADELALKIYDKDLSATALFCVADALTENDAEQLNSVLRRLLEKCDDLEEFHLRSCVSIAGRKLKSADLAAQFAGYLFEYFEDFHLETLRICAVAFYNNGDIARAKEVARLLQSYVPEDLFCMILLDYFKRAKGSSADNLGYAEGLTTHYVYPDAILVSVADWIEKHIDDGASKRKFLYMSVLADALKETTRNRAVTYGKNTLIKALRQEGLCNERGFVKFAVNTLRAPYADKTVNALLLKQLALKGYVRPVCVNYADTATYMLNMSLLSGANGKLLDVLCSVAARSEFTEIIKPILVQAYEVVVDDKPACDSEQLVGEIMSYISQAYGFADTKPEQTE
ncbi:MAG: hypothetical protein NC350_05575, partial [Corallococcus sp.]|nr:hypothetical protein [Corallococcus sp.]